MLRAQVRKNKRIAMAIEQQSTNNTPIEDKELSKEDVVDLLNQDDETEEEVVDDDKVAKVKEEDDEPVIKEEEEIKLKEDDIEELEDEEEPSKKDFVLTPAKRAEILKQFPDFFKKFPE